MTKLHSNLYIQFLDGGFLSELDDGFITKNSGITTDISKSYTIHR